MAEESMQIKLARYNEAKETYYNSGESIMSDYEFDVLENQLLAAGLIDKEVGAEVHTYRTKVQHPTRMLSLAKVQVFTEKFEMPHYEQVKSLLSRHDSRAAIDNVTTLEYSWKLDGCSANTIWEGGRLIMVLTRNNGTVGFDVTDKMRSRIPQRMDISSDFSGEIRGEFVMRTATFDSKYAGRYQNPRNLVSGIINDEDKADPRVQDVDFVPFDIRHRHQPGICHNFSSLDSSLRDAYVEAACPSRSKLNVFSLMEQYDSYSSRRAAHAYGVDGIVVRLHGVPHGDIRHNDHDPFHVCAIKFPPKETVTKLLRIDWQLNRTGKYTPIGILEPVDLDGSTVRRVSLHNYRNVVQQRVYPGSELVIAKNGDIIPALQRVHSRPTDYTEQMLVDSLPSGTRIEGPHLVDDGSNADWIDRIKFIHAMNVLGFEDFGDNAYSRLHTFTAGDFTLLFDNQYTNFDNLRIVWNGHATRQKFIHQLTKRKIDGIHVHQLILMLGIDGMGHKTSWQLALMESDQPHSTRGLDRSVIAEFERSKHRLHDMYARLAHYGVKIVFAEPEAPKSSITFEMTGDVNVPGYKKKSDVVAALSSWSHTPLKRGTTYLITDSLDSRTNKMAAAAKFGAEIITYARALELHAQSN